MIKEYLVTLVKPTWPDEFNMKYLVKGPLLVISSSEWDARTAIKLAQPGWFVNKIMEAHHD